MKIFYLIAFCLNLIGCMKKPEPELHLIPNDFRGKVTIRFAQPQGQQEEQEGRFRLYRIPSNGILNTQYQSNLGVKTKEDNLFFIVNEMGTRTRLPRFDEPNLAPTSLVVSNLYANTYVYYYFVDELQNIKNYPNPLLDESERNWNVNDPGHIDTN